MSVLNKKYVPILFLVLIMVLLAYLNSKTYVIPGNFVIGEDDSVPASANSQDQLKNSENPMMYTLEEKLVDTYEKDGYTIEKYQEYEVYKDDKGNVIKSIPTSKVDYLRYQITE